MPQWWISAAQALKRRPQEVPQGYEVRCVCGGTVSGVRIRTHQLPPCPKCGTFVFVLPASVYPLVEVKLTTPPKPATKTKGREQLAASETVECAAKPQATVADQAANPRKEKKKEDA